MKLSFIQKIKLSFALEGLFTKLMNAILPIIFLSWLLIGKSDLPEIPGVIVALSMSMYGFYLSVYLIMSFTFSFSGMKFLKTLPVTNNNIFDIAVTGLVTTAISAALGQTVFTAAASRFYLMPYFLCMDAAIMAIASVFAPIYIKINFTKSNRKDESEFKRQTIKAIIMLTTYIIVCTAVSCLIIYHASLNDISSARIWIAVISAASLIVFAASMIRFHKMNISVEC